MKARTLIGISVGGLVGLWIVLAVGGVRFSDQGSGVWWRWLLAWPLGIGAGYKLGNWIAGTKRLSPRLADNSVWSRS